MRRISLATRYSQSLVSARGIADINSSLPPSSSTTARTPELDTPSDQKVLLIKNFATIFPKHFMMELSKQRAVTRKAARRWMKRLSGRSSVIASRDDIAENQQYQMNLVRSLAIRTPKSGGGTEPAKPSSDSLPSKEGKKEDAEGKTDPAPKKDEPSQLPEDSTKKPPITPGPSNDPKKPLSGSSSVDGKDKQKKKGSGDEDEEEDDADEPDTITPMVTKFVLGVFVLSGILYYMSKPNGRLSSWEEVAQRTDALMRVDVYQEFAEFHFAEGPPLHVGLLYDDNHTEMKLKALLAKATLGEGFNTNYIGEGAAESILHFVGVFAWIVPFIFFPSFVMILTRAIGTAMTGVQEGKNKVTSKVMFQVQKGSNTRFSDIAGMTEAKQEVTEIVDFLKHPERYTRLGAKVPTGALLLGPPGTGKTLLAKAVAGEAGVAFIPCTGSDFVELYVGMGALRVRQLFELAKKQRCIIYIDEIDAIGLKRSGAGHGEKQEQEHTLNELLTQLDGFGSQRGEVMILASSNVSQNELDPALIRPGRFDRLVNVDTPVIKERIDIFKVHLSNLKLVAPSTPATPPTTQTEHAAAKISSILSDDDGKGEATKAVPFTDPSAPAAKPIEAPKEVTSTTSSSSVPSSMASSVAVVPGTKTEETLLDEEDENKDIARKKMTAAAASALEEKLSKLTDEERHLVNIYANRMSDLCPGFVGADIMNVCNEAAILAAREDCKCVTISHLERSIDRVLAGIEHRSRVLSPFEKNVVAHHEAGHAVAGWFLGRADPLMKVNIVPRGGSALGYAQYLPNENHMRTSNEIKDSICVTLGGRAAEKIFFDHLSTGASDDLRKVTRMAYMHVSSFNTTTAHHAPGSSATRYVKPYGAAISDKIDAAAKELVDTLFERTVELLKTKKKEMELLANHLLKHEVLTHADVIAYLGTRPPRPSDTRKYYLEAENVDTAASSAKKVSV